MTESKEVANIRIYNISKILQTIHASILMTHSHYNFNIKNYKNELTFLKTLMALVIFIFISENTVYSNSTKPCKVLLIWWQLFRRLVILILNGFT